MRRSCLKMAAASSASLRWSRGGLGFGISDGGISDGRISDGGISDGGISDGGIYDGAISNGVDRSRRRVHAGCKQSKSKKK